MLGRLLHGGAYIAGDDITLHQISHVVHQQPKPVLRQAAQLCRQGIHHVLHDQGRFERYPEAKQQQCGNSAPERRLKTVVNRQGVQITDTSPDYRERPFASQVKGQGTHPQQYNKQDNRIHLLLKLKQDGRPIRPTAWFKGRLKSQRFELLRHPP